MLFGFCLLSKLSASSNLARPTIVANHSNVIPGEIGSTNVVLGETLVLHCEVPSQPGQAITLRWMTQVSWPVCK